MNEFRLSIEKIDGSGLLIYQNNNTAQIGSPRQFIVYQKINNKLNLISDVYSYRHIWARELYGFSPNSLTNRWIPF